MSSPDDSGCTPTTSLLRFDGGYEVSMCYRTPDGATGQAKAGLYASAKSGLLWFFSRDNAEVLVKVLNGCSINGHRWVFAAPVTTLEFDLWVTSPTGKRWTHGNTQGVTAATKSDTAAFACADEPDAAADLIVSGVSASGATPVADRSAGQSIAFRSTALNMLNSGDDGDSPAAAPNGREGSASATSLRYYSSSDEAIDASDALIAGDAAAAPTLAAGRQTGTTPDTPNGKAPVPMPVPATSSSTPGCTPTTSLLRFDGGYEISMCYRTPDGVAGQAKAGIYASAESGLLWFFSRDNPEALVKVLNGCSINGYRWVFVAPVTTLEFDLWVTSPTGKRWTHGNTQGVTAAGKGDTAAFACADEPEAAPDLIVSRVSVSDATPDAGETITLQATVRNRGDGPASSTTLRFYRSSDSAISASDNSDDLLASEAVAALSASATASRTFQFRVPSTPGTFYLGACIDSVSAESRTGNNCSNGVRVTVDDEPDEDPEATPDLTVSGVSVNDATPVAGQIITLRATVRNRGDGPASSTMLRFYRSDDSTIGTTDHELDSEAVPALSASATESRTFDFRVPSTPGTFYLGACIDSVSAESRTGNNCSNGVRVVVEEPDENPEEPEATPDLNVSSFSVSHEDPVAGQTITLRAMVRNRGDGPATPTTLRFYRSEDLTIGMTDHELDSEAVPALVASATESRTFQFKTPSTPGTIYLGACIDSVSGESDTGNNCSDGVRVTVEEPGPPADLTVSRFSVSHENPAVGMLFQQRATVRNRGDGPAPPTTLRFYLSSDSTISTSDQRLVERTVRALDPSATQTWTNRSSRGEPGTFYYGACVDPVFGESDTSNNCSDGVLVVVGEPEPRPDLIVSSVSVSEAKPDPDQTIEFRATVQNRGDAPATPTTLRYYRSTDPTIGRRDTELGSEDVAALADSATVSATFDFTTPSTPQTFYLGACVDSVSDELFKRNNCSEGVLVAEKTPDLTVSSVSVSDENAFTGDAVELQVTVRNRGDAPATPTTLRYYRSTDPTIGRRDTELGSEDVAALADSATVSATFDFTTPSTPQTFYFGACVDSVSRESDTGNNCSDGVPVAVELEEPPDLIVSGISVSDENPAIRELFEQRATVRNSGVGPAPPTTLRFYLSSDSTISTSDQRLVERTVRALDPSATQTWTNRSSFGERRTFYFGACVDPVAGESDTSNNCSDGVLVVVGEAGPRPDLIVSSVSVSDARPDPDQTIEFRATVQNRGEVPATPTTLRYYRSNDSTIGRRDTELGSEDVAGLAASATVSTTFDFTTPSTFQAFYLGACVDSVSDELFRRNNCSVGVLVTEKTPDLTVSSVSVSDENVFTGDAVELQVTVKNRGDAPATPTTLRYYQSNDSKIGRQDTELGSEDVAALAASATESTTFDFTTPSTPRTFYFGVCVDSVSRESDTDNNCSDGVPVTVALEEPPDLVVSSVSVSDENPAVGRLFQQRVTVLNSGVGPAPPTTLRFYLSSDSTISTSDQRLVERTVRALDPSATQTWTNRSSFGERRTFYFGACVDPVAGESDTSNNCSDGVLVVVGEAGPRPDLIAYDISVSNENPAPGSVVELQVKVQNRGDSSATPTTLRYYRSNDSTIDKQDTVLGSEDVAALPTASAAESKTFDFTIPSTPQAFYIGACVDFVSDELFRRNNCSDGVLVTVE